MKQIYVDYSIEYIFQTLIMWERFVLFYVIVQKILCVIKCINIKNTILNNVQNSAVHKLILKTEITNYLFTKSDLRNKSFND